MAKLTASDGEHGDSFGDSVAIDGATVVVGAFSDNLTGTIEAPSNEGSAYVFHRDGDSWTEITKLTASNGQPFDRFGCAVAIDGDVALIGASSHGGSGAAYVFERSSDTWTERTVVQASNRAALDNFGGAVAIDGPYAVIGTHYKDVSALYAHDGSAYVFELEDGGWHEAVQLTADEPTSYDYFGWSVATAGAYVIVGAPQTGPRHTGSGFVFQLVDGVWTPIARLAPSDAGEFEGIGSAAAFDGASAILSAGGAEGEKGAAYIFAR